MPDYKQRKIIWEGGGGDDLRHAEQFRIIYLGPKRNERDAAFMVEQRSGVDGLGNPRWGTPRKDNAINGLHLLAEHMGELIVRLSTAEKIDNAEDFLASLDVSGNLRRAERRRPALTPQPGQTIVKSA